MLLLINNQKQLEVNREVLAYSIEGHPSRKKGVHNLFAEVPVYGVLHHTGLAIRVINRQFIYFLSPA